MPLNLPNLDDRTYTDLVEEALTLIPSYAPAWTNHNAADPGITLVELFAYLSEILIYRINRVTDANRLAFLRLINGPGWELPKGASLTEQIRLAVQQMREANRAVTCQDFERLACANPQVARARCIPNRNLESENTLTDIGQKPGHVSLVIVPRGPAANPQPSPELIQAVSSDFQPRLLLTTQLHVVGPRYFPLGVRLGLALNEDAVAETFLFQLDNQLRGDIQSHTVSAGLIQAFADQKIALPPDTTIAGAGGNWLVASRQPLRRYWIRDENGLLMVYEDTARTAAITALLGFFDPLSGGKDGQGWPFGQDVFVSEIYQLLDRLPAVDHVEASLDTQNHSLPELTVADKDSQRLVFDRFGNLSAVKISQNELIDVQNMTFDLSILSPRTS